MKASYTHKLDVQDLGLIDYEKALVLQRQSVDQVILGGAEKLILCEHPPVITLGRMSKQENLLFSHEQIKQQGVEIKVIDRGGDVTLHMPGQLVIYPIMNLNNYGKDLHVYLHKLEQVAIDLLKHFGIVACRFPGRTGVWVGKQKLVSLGIGVRKWVAYHGLGVNVCPNLNLFSLIRPCGLDVKMTSIEDVLKRNISMDEVKEKVIDCFERVFKIGV